MFESELNVLPAKISSHNVKADSFEGIWFLRVFKWINYQKFLWKGLCNKLERLQTKNMKNRTK